MTWPVVKLGSLITDERSGASLKKDQFTDAGVGVVPKKAISESVDLLTDTLVYTSENIYHSSTSAQVDDKFLITTLRNLNPDGSTLGLICRHEHDDKLMLAQGMYAFRLSNDISPDYLCFASRTPSFREQIQKIKVGSTQVHIRAKEFKEIEIPLPPLAEQQRIAAILDKADAIRRKRQQANQLADDFLRAVFLDMFGDPVTNPKDWEVKPLGECLKFLTSGSRGWAKYYSETGSKFIRIQNVSKNKLLIDDMAFVTAPDGAEATRTKVRLDDVLLSITADLGRSSVVTDEIVGGHINQHLALLRLDTETLNPRYLSAYLSSDAGVRQFERKNKSAVKAGLNFTDIKTLEIMVPSIEKQAEYQKLYEKLTSNETKRIDSDLLLTTVFDALSQKAFRGEL